MKIIYVRDYEPRLKAPINNKFYIKEPWGLNRALEISKKTHSVLPNCCGYDHGRWLEICDFQKGDEYPKLCLGDAHSYYNYPDGYERSKTPRVGDIACWKGGTYGHVGIVEKVEKDGTITVSMSQYGGNPVFYLRELKAPYDYQGRDYMHFQGFIRCPYVKDNPEMTEEVIQRLAEEVLEGKWGNGQTRYRRLTEAGYDYQKVQARVNKILADQREFKVGDQVKIVNKGNSQANGLGHNAYGYGWTRKILKIYAGAKFPYQVGNDNGTTGFYTKEALKKL